MMAIRAMGNPRTTRARMLRMPYSYGTAHNVSTCRMVRLVLT
jgi:hypothetical protein